MDNTNLIDILTSEENIETTINIFEQDKEIQHRIREIFVKQIKDICWGMGYCCEYDPGILDCRNNTWIRIFDESYKNVIFRIGAYKFAASDGCRMDLLVAESYKATEKFDYTIWPESAEPTEDKPIGWSYFWSESGIKDSGEWWSWWSWNTLKDMSNGKMVAFILERLKIIKENDVFRRINDSLVKIQ